jgi:hypothetical protein
VFISDRRHLSCHRRGAATKGGNATLYCVI